MYFFQSKLRSVGRESVHKIVKTRAILTKLSVKILE